MNINRENILDNLLPVRLTLYRENPSKNYVLQILSKYLELEELELFSLTTFEYSKVSDTITVLDTPELLHRLYLHLDTRSIVPVEFTPKYLKIKVTDFFNKLL